MQKLQKFKKTELGEIPQEWSIDKLGNLVNILVGYPFPSKEYSDIGIRLVRGDNVTEGKLRWGDRIRYWNKVTPHLKKFLLKKDDYLIGMDGSKVGKNYARVREDDLPCLLVQRVACLRVNDKLIQNYLDYIIGNKDFIDYVDSTKTNAVIPHISSRQISDYKIRVPTVKEQQKIASILSNVDELIQKTEQIIEQTQRLKEGLMQRLLTKGIGHTKFKKVKFHLRFLEEQVPESWSIKPIKKVSISGFRNGIFKKRNEFGTGVPLVNVSDLFSENDINIKTLERVRVNNNELKQFAIEEGDIFFCRSSLVIDGIGRSNIVTTLPEPSVFECHVMMLRPDKEKIIPKFLKYYLDSQIAKKFLFSIAMTLTMTTIRQPDLENLPIVLPSLEEQRKIISHLKQIDTKINYEKLRLENLSSLKKGLMQQLLTGKIRVKV